MSIRRASVHDIPALNRLLCQVLEVHHQGRPDLFKGWVKKYTDLELGQLLLDDKRPVFVYEEEGKVLGYCFCILLEQGDNILTDIRTLYIDDLCVEESQRRKGIAKALFQYVKTFAKEQGCYNLTLNVWELNPGARRFYESCGLLPQKTVLETIL